VIVLVLLMCRNLSEHNVKQILAVICNPLATNSFWLKNSFTVVKHLNQCIQIYLALPQPWFDSADDEPTLFSENE
jgi:hypothetical protein